MFRPDREQGIVERIAGIAIAAIIICNCGSRDASGSGPVARPAGQHSASRPAAEPASKGRPTTAPYNVIGRTHVVAAAMLQVNDKFISLEQVLNPLRRRLATEAARLSPADFRLQARMLIREETLRQVRRTLVLAQATKRLDEAEQKFIDGELEKAYLQLLAEFGGGSRTVLSERMEQEGTSLAAWRKELRRALMAQLYLRRMFLPQIAVTRKQMWDHYRRHIDKFRTQPKVQMQIVAAPFSAFSQSDVGGGPTTRPSRTQQAKLLIGKAAAALAKGEEFGKVAREYSKGPLADKGGIWPLMGRGNFREAVEEAAFKQDLGQVSGIIETPEGFYIVKTIKREEGRETHFEQVQDQIELELHGRQYEKVSNEYLTKLLNRATIQSVGRFEQAAVEAAVRRYAPR